MKSLGRVTILARRPQPLHQAGPTLRLGESDRTFAFQIGATFVIAAGNAENGRFYLYFMQQLSIHYENNLCLVASNHNTRYGTMPAPAMSGFCEISEVPQYH
jgi:hypothetical protein